MPAIEPRGKGLVAFTLREHDEVIDPDEVFAAIKASKAERKMIEIAEKTIEQQEAAFDPSRFHDRNEDALKALIRKKEEQGGKPVEAEAPEAKEDNVVDLMEALRRSLGKKAPAAVLRARQRATAHRAARRPAACPARRRA